MVCRSDSSRGSVTLSRLCVARKIQECACPTNTEASDDLKNGFLLLTYVRILMAVVAACPARSWDMPFKIIGTSQLVRDTLFFQHFPYSFLAVSTLFPYSCPTVSLQFPYSIPPVSNQSPRCTLTVSPKFPPISHSQFHLRTYGFPMVSLQFPYSVPTVPPQSPPQFL